MQITPVVGNSGWHPVDAAAAGIGASDDEYVDTEQRPSVASGLAADTAEGAAGPRKGAFFKMGTCHPQASTWTTPRWRRTGRSPRGGSGGSCCGA